MKEEEFEYLEEAISLLEGRRLLKKREMSEHCGVENADSISQAGNQDFAMDDDPLLFRKSKRSSHMSSVFNYWKQLRRGCNSRN